MRNFLRNSGNRGKISRYFLGLTGLVMASGFGQADLDTLAYWRFEENPGENRNSGAVLDLAHIQVRPSVIEIPAASGPGANFPGVVPRTGEENRQAASFAGFGDPKAGLYFRPDDDQVIPRGSFTVEAFVNWQGAEAQYVVSRWSSADARCFAFGVSAAGNLEVRISPDGQSDRVEVLTSGLTLRSKRDYAVAVGLDLNGGEAVFYLKDLESGAEAESETISHGITEIFQGRAPVAVGGLGTSLGNQQWQGLIDEVRITSRALSSGELLMNAN